MDNKDLFTLSMLVGPCPERGNGRLQPVADGEQTNFLCATCGKCWHPELEWVSRVNPQTCPGCPSSAVCLGARRAYGERVPDLVWQPTTGRTGCRIPRRRRHRPSWA